MPLFLLVFGILFFVAAIRGQDETNKLLALLKSDFTGPGNFFLWALAIGSIAALGYVKALKPVSSVALGMVFLVIVLKKKGPNGEDLISSFFTQIGQTQFTSAT